MRIGLLGRKVGMTQIYQDDGTAVPVTVLECGPCTVLQLRTPERDGYHAVQLGFLDKKRKSATQAERGHARKAEAEPKRFVREIHRLARLVGTEGRTAHRATVTGLAGSWSNALECVNTLVGDLVAPTDEMARVIGTP